MFNEQLKVNWTGKQRIFCHLMCVLFTSFSSHSNDVCVHWGCLLMAVDGIVFVWFGYVDKELFGDENGNLDELAAI